MKDPTDDPQDSAGFVSGSQREKVCPEGVPPRVAAASPVTLDVLRAKLDRAIVAEAWDAVKAIRERMIDVEREEAGNVVTLPARKGGR